MSEKSNQVSPQVRERAVRLAGRSTKARTLAVGRHRIHRPGIGCVSQTLNEWVRRDEIDNGVRVGVATTNPQRLKELERESKELRKANEIRKLASAL